MLNDGPARLEFPLGKHEGGGANARWAGEIAAAQRGIATDEALDHIRVWRQQN
jgi:hypothetical protein